MKRRYGQSIDCSFYLYLRKYLEHPLVLQVKLMEIHKQPWILKGQCPPLLLLLNPKEPEGDERTSLNLLTWPGEKILNLHGTP